MKIIGIIYIIVGVLAISGAIAAALVSLSVSQALGGLNSSTVDADPAVIQDYVGKINFVLILGWMWLIGVFVSGIIAVRLGIDAVRTKVQKR